MIEKIIAVLLSALIWCLAAVPAHAAEPLPEETEETVTLETETDDKNIIVNVTVQAPAAVETTPEPTPEVTIEPVEETEEVRAVATFRVVNDSAQREEDSFAQTILDLFGEYSPRTQTVTEIMSDGSTVTRQEIVPGLAGLDWVWIVEVLLFALVLWRLLCMVGGLFK